jgi:hypothetical protein
LPFWPVIMLSCQTDTASVLSEAIEYIKFLHEQVTVSDLIQILHPSSENYTKEMMQDMSCK